jgi:CheY-like chemotaxis protein
VAVRRPKVVVIDDSEVVLEVTKNALEGAGYEVITHDRPAGCVALILHEKPDLVLMDVNMPGLGGDTIVSVFARAQPSGETVVLLYSSLSAEVLRTKAAAAGAHGFIQKSGDLFGLVREVSRWLKRTNTSGQVRAAFGGANDEPRSSGTRAAASVSLAGSPRGFDAKPNEGAPTVLLVDDEMSMLSVYRRQLQAEDWLIEFALSGSQALRRMLSDSPPDAVVCDMLLPDLTGIEVYERAVAAQPSYRKRFVVATGATSSPPVAAFLTRFGGPVLQKPIDDSKLLAAVRSCLRTPANLKSSARA